MKTARFLVAYVLVCGWLMTLDPRPAAAQQAACRAGNLLAGKPPWCLAGPPRAAATWRPTASPPTRGPSGTRRLALVLDTGAATVTWDLGRRPRAAGGLGAGRRQRLRTRCGARWTARSFTGPGADRHRSTATGCAGARLPSGAWRSAISASARGEGDSFYSLSELQVFCTARRPSPRDRRSRRRRPPRSCTNIYTYWNDESQRALGAGAGPAGPGAAAVGRRATPAGRDRAYRRKLRDRLLALLGVLAALTYINFGSFHFGNFIHDWEWTHYYVGSKYFPELSYDRLYECIAIADVEDGLRQRVELRKLTNLRTNVLESSDEIAKHPERCKQQLHAARWRLVQEGRRASSATARAPSAGTICRPTTATTAPRSGTWPARLLSNLAPGHHHPAVPAGDAGSAVPAGHLSRSSGGPSAGGCWRWLCWCSRPTSPPASTGPAARSCAGTGCSTWWPAIACLRKERPVLGGRRPGLRRAPARVSRLRLRRAGAGAGLAPLLQAPAAGAAPTPASSLGAALATRLLVPLSAGRSRAASQRLPALRAEHDQAQGDAADQLHGPAHGAGLSAGVRWGGAQGRQADRSLDQLEAGAPRRLEERPPLYVVLVLGFLVLMGLAARHVEPWVAAALGRHVHPHRGRADLLLLRLHHRGGAAGRAARGGGALVAVAHRLHPVRGLGARCPGMPTWLDEQYTLMSLATVGVFAAIVWLYRRPLAADETAVSSGAAWVASSSPATAPRPARKKP